MQKFSPREVPHWCRCLLAELRIGSLSSCPFPFCHASPLTGLWAICRAEVSSGPSLGTSEIWGGVTGFSPGDVSLCLCPAWQGASKITLRTRGWIYGWVNSRSRTRGHGHGTCWLRRPMFLKPTLSLNKGRFTWGFWSIYGIPGATLGDFPCLSESSWWGMHYYPNL